MELTDLGDDVPRPMANADFDALAKEAYEKKYPGKKWEELAYATRKKYYYQAQRDFEKRTGKPAYSPAPGNMKFKDYFLQLDEKTQRSYLGPERFKLWKSGGLDLEKFIPPFPDRAFTVKELKEMDKKSFKAYGEKISSKPKFNSVDFTNDPNMIIKDDGISIQRLNTTKGKEQWDIVPEEVKKILEHEKVRGIPKHFMLKTDDTQHGFILTDGSGRVIFFNVAHNSKHAALTAVHETGHVIDKLFMTKKQRDKILEIIKESEEYKSLVSKRDFLVKRNYLGRSEKKMLGDFNNALENDELIARAYVQNILKNKKGILLEQFKEDAILHGTDRYFISVQDKLNNTFSNVLRDLFE